MRAQTRQTAIEGIEMSDEKRRPARPHRGTYDEGQSVDDHHSEDRPKGDFARGQREGSDAVHEETFAEGQEEREHHPEDHRRGDFARGGRTRDRDDRDD